MPTDKTKLDALNTMYIENEGNVEAMRTTTRLLLGEW